jgi:L-ascorbate metabolism protein UlaG (beta-lactamase superfamily)
MTKRKVFGIKKIIIGIIFFVIQFYILNGCFQIQASKMSKNKLNKEHHLEDGSFKNNYASSINKPFSDLIKWRWNRTQPEPFNFKLHKNDPKFLKENRDIATLTWIGHSTLLLQHKGVNILTDPHLTQRASPFSFAGPKRLTPPGLLIEDLPIIDLIVISHNHYDHLDKLTIKTLYERQPNHPPKIFVPLKLKQWCLDLGIKNGTELDWKDSVKCGEWKIHAVPVQHWSSRSPFDRNKTLWSVWVLETEGFRFFFAGDTGYSKDFKNIRDQFGQIDLAAIPIGAYEPRWFMKAAHVNPEEAVMIHQDINARFSVGIHWGTFILTDEPVIEPPKRLLAALKKEGISKEKFFVMKHGETKMLDFLIKEKK